MRIPAMCAAMLALLVAANAHAGAVSLLTFDGSPDLLEDDDYETFIDHDGDGKIGVGDFVVGMYYFQQINGADTAVAGATFEGILVAKVTGVGGAATTLAGVPFDGNTLTFGAVSAAEYTILKTTYGLSNLPTREKSASALIVYDDQGGAPFVNPSAGTGINDALATATNGTKLFEFGFVGNAFSDAAIVPFFGLVFNLGLNKTHSELNVAFIPVNPLSALGYPATHVQGQGTTDFVNPKGHFHIKTDADVQINMVVPEPGSLTLLGLGALGMLGVRFRRKKVA